MNGKRAIWLVYGTDTEARGFWLVKRKLKLKNVRPENFLEINRYFALTSYCHTIGQSNNAFSILGFSSAGNEESILFWSFHPLADKTNSEHSPKPFFKVIWKSLYNITLYVRMILYTLCTVVFHSNGQYIMLPAHCKVKTVDQG